MAVDDGILGGLKDILFGTTGPRGGKKDGVVQTMAKAPPAGDESDCARDVGEFAGEKKVSRCDLSLPDATLARLIMPTPLQHIEFS